VTFLDWPERVCAENPHKYGTEKDAEVPTAVKPDFWRVVRGRKGCSRSVSSRACLHVPKGSERSPAILLLHGSEGGVGRWTASLALALAMKGFVTFAYPYSKGGNFWRAGDIHDDDLDETVDALRWLREYPAVSGKVGLYGHSRRAEHAILLTSLMAMDQSPFLTRSRRILHPIPSPAHSSLVTGIRRNRRPGSIKTRVALAWEFRRADANYAD
jgi:hypothetical protein